MKRHRSDGYLRRPSGHFRPDTHKRLKVFLDLGVYPPTYRNNSPFFAKFRGRLCLTCLRRICANVPGATGYARFASGAV